MSCSRCGKCCQHAYFDVHIANGDPKDVIPWAEAHGCKIIRRGDKFMLKVLHSCDNLKLDLRGGHRCKIYDQRPKMCRDYTCPEAKDESI